jgi:hypothetical protein
VLGPALFQFLARSRPSASLAVAAAAQTFTFGTTDANRYLNTIKALITPAMEGRGAGTKGLTRAAHLLEQCYQGLGLVPAGTQDIFSRSA